MQSHPCCLFGRERKNVEGNTAHHSSVVALHYTSQQLRAREYNRSRKLVVAMGR